MAARGALDTDDIVQNVAMHVVKRLEQFEPRHVGAMQGYLHQAVINRIRDEMRSIGRHPPLIELPDDAPSDRASPLESAIEAETYDRYREALTHFSPKIRRLVVARVEMQWSFAEIAHRFDFPSIEAARMAVSRALRRLAKQLDIPR
jgi:RNA polymerase sigma factor (sigma-70 family)